MSSSQSTNASDTCLNCQAPLSGEKKFCSSCGQENTRTNVPFSVLLAEVVENFFNFDSRLFRTLKVLVRYPGRLTADFNSGKRACYVSPLRLYISMSVLFFLVLSINQEREFRRLSINKQMDQQKSKNGKITIGLVSRSYVLTVEELKKIPDLTDAQLDSLIIAKNGKPEWLTRVMFRQVPKLITDDGTARFSEKLVSNVSVGMFLLMPFFGGLLTLFFRKSAPFYVQHLIHSIHLHAAFFLFFFIVECITWLTDYSVVGIVLFFGLIYIWFSLRRVYQQSWIKTTWKLLLLALLQLLMIGAFMVVLAFVSILNL